MSNTTDAPARSGEIGPIPGRNRAVLVILDGWGLREEAVDNAVTVADTPTWDRLWNTDRYPRARLITHGPAVGLPEGQMGNSEVGHLNLGAGRVVMQTIQRITAAIASGEFFSNPALIEVMNRVRDRGKTLHLMGLVGRGGVHAIDSHLLALCELAARHQIAHTVVHAFLDGRDTPPQSAREFLTELIGRIGGHAGAQGAGCEIATVMGRYWAMDRDKRWDRTERAYRAVVYGEGLPVQEPISAVAEAYSSGESDEFIQPRIIVDDGGRPVSTLEDGDAVIFFNFRADRGRQLSRALADERFDAFDRGPGAPRVEVVTMTPYDAELQLQCAFPPQPMENLLADVLAQHGRTSYRTAETEKYPHVTYFFNGGREEPYPGEERHLVPSPKVATYDLQPEMSAEGVADGLVEAILSRRHDLYVCNFANPDMVGHTGVMEAAVRAVQTVDRQLGRVVEACREAGVTLVVTADHGNCEQMYDPETHGPHTAHTLNPVGIILVEPDGTRRTRALSDGALCDVAPTLLGILGVPQPPDMNGRDLRAPLDG
jgi:2,3-bisphosphoglycerate-independent phosphoglycerate mutase